MHQQITKQGPSVEEASDLEIKHQKKKEIKRAITFGRWHNGPT